MLTDIAWQYYIMRQLKNIDKTSMKKMENIKPKEDNKPNSRSFFCLISYIEIFTGFAVPGLQCCKFRIQRIRTNL